MHHLFTLHRQFRLQTEKRLNDIKMKFIVSSLFLALLVVAANAASLEKVEKDVNVDPKVVADNVEPASAEHAVHAPVLKSEPVEIVEAKSEEAAEEKIHSGEKVGAEAPELRRLGFRQAEQSDKLPLTILYEALCPDSRALIAELGREYHDFEPYLSLNLVPFGRAKSLDAEGKEFECHHGPEECVANRIQSCALEHLKIKPDAQEQFVVCQMRKDSEPSGRECAEQAGSTWSEVQACVDGELGRKLQLAAEDETKAARDPLTNVPTVLFNNKFDEGLQEKAVKGLRSTLCELLSEKKLEVCPAKA